MNTRLVFSLLAASFLAAGCATPEATTTGERAEADVITGSRIPRKGAENPSGVKVIEGAEAQRGQMDKPPIGMRGN
jgi:hypothetical protein